MQRGRRFSDNVITGACLYYTCKGNVHLGRDWILFQSEKFSYKYWQFQNDLLVKKKIIFEVGFDPCPPEGRVLTIKVLLDAFLHILDWKWIERDVNIFTRF